MSDNTIVKAERITDIPKCFSLKPLLDLQDMKNYYEDTMEIRTGRKGFSPIDDIYDACTMPSENNAILLMGHRGCGKSTELNKLKQKLTVEGYPVRIISCIGDADIANLAYSDLMILMAEGILSLADEKGVIPNKDDSEILFRFWDSEERETILTDEYGASGETGINIETPRFLRTLLKAFLSVKADLRTGVEKKTVYRERINLRVTVWLEAIKRIADKIAEKCCEKQPILIFEDLDKGQQAVWEVFTQYSAQLSSLSFPIIYTFPVSYYYDHRFGAVAGYYSIKKLPMIKVLNIDGTRNEEGINKIRSIVEKRADMGLFDNGVLDYLILKTGGSLRHLFRTINTAARISNRLQCDRIEMSCVTGVLQEIKGELSARLSGDDYDFLVEVYKGNHLTCSKADLLKEMMLNEIVLEYNGVRWHNVHPLIVDYLKDIGRLESESHEG